jgi:YegS/Rv2252/BmrU family lipid kinase
VTFQRIAVIYNPHSGRPRERQSEVDRFTAQLRAAGRTVLIAPTAHPGHATGLAREAVATGCDLVVAHGGDGTMNEVLQAVAGTEATLGFWPGGTANVLAAELKFPSRADDVVERILAGQVRRVTAGRANDRYFLLMAGIGLDAAVAASVDPLMKQRFGKAAFGLSAMKFVRNWHLPPFLVELDRELMPARFVVAGNAHSYGGGFQITPQADLSEPCLDLCIFTQELRMDYLQIALAAVAGRHLRMAGVTYRKVRRVRILGDQVPVQLDGEVTGSLPLTLEAVPGSLKLLV